LNPVAEGANEAVAAAAKTAQNILGLLVNDSNTRYYLKAKADVEDIALDPSDTNEISLNDLGEFNRSFNL